MAGGIEYIGDTPGDIERRLSETATLGQRKADEALRETAEDMKSDLEDSSPVDTGEYQDSWYIFPVDEGEVWILNEADHAKYVMLPNSKMVGSSKADLPGSGVLHNVKGRARRHSGSYRQSLIENIEEMMGDLSIE